MPAGPNGLSFVSVRFTGGERVARVTVRSGAAALEPGEPEPPQADVAAIDDVIFGEPLPDEAPPVEPESVPDRAGVRVAARAVAARVADPAGPQGPRRAHAEGRARLLGRRERDALARPHGRVASRPHAGAKTVNFRVPAKAKKGKQKLRLRLVDAAGATGTKAVTITVN